MNIVTAYFLVYIIGPIGIIGLLVFIFENSAQIRLVDLFLVIASFIFGNLIARTYWPKKNTEIEENGNSI
jgi:hypothetical protein